MAAATFLQTCIKYYHTAGKVSAKHVKRNLARRNIAIEFKFPSIFTPLPLPLNDWGAVCYLPPHY